MNATCSVDDCAKPASTRGWCRMHYIRWNRHGDVTAIKRYAGVPDPKKFERGLGYETGSGCWIWTGRLNNQGYPWITGIPGRFAHRYSYELHIGPIGDLQLDHLCRTPACVNPWHLDPVPGGENIRRMYLDGGRKCTPPEVVLAIRAGRAEGRSYYAMGKEFGIARSVVRRIALGELRTLADKPKAG